MEVFKSPVSTACGHNFCRACITTCWDGQVQSKCSLCNEHFPTRPDLRVNTFISMMVDQVRRSVVPLTEEYEEKKVQLGKMESEVQQMMQERRRKIQEIKDTVKLSQADVDREIADGEQVLADLMCRINQAVKEKVKSRERQAEWLIKELEREIEDLTTRSSEVEQLSHIEDPLHFLQSFGSLKKPPPTRDWTEVEVRPPSYVETLRRSLGQLEETLNMEVKKKCVFSLIHHHTHSLFTWKVHTAGGHVCSFKSSWE